MGAPEQVAHVPQDGGDGGPELVGGVLEEAGLGLKGLLQAGEHPVQGLDQGGHLVPGFRLR